VRYRVRSLTNGLQEGLSLPDANSASRIRRCLQTPSIDFLGLSLGVAIEVIKFKAT